MQTSIPLASAAAPKEPHDLKVDPSLLLTNQDEEHKPAFVVEQTEDEKEEEEQTYALKQFKNNTSKDVAILN